MSIGADSDLFDEQARDYDAVVVVSFGGPEGPHDVEPFLDRVLSGLPVKPETRARIAQRYQAFGGVSPINGHTREFIAALQRELDHHGPALPIYWGNRNWHPLLADTFKQMDKDGVSRAIAFVTSTFSSYSGCRKYREDLYQAAQSMCNAPQIDRLRLGFNHPGFIAAATDRVAETLHKIPASRRGETPILFSAHSLPESMAHNCDYEQQLGESCILIAAALEHSRWQLVYQSNNASYSREAWLAPDIRDAIGAAKKEGADDVVVAPIGFNCDHMEVVLDLDIEAQEHAASVGITMHRAATVGTHPAYVSMVRDLIVERMSAAPERPALGSLGPSYDYCPTDCCLSGKATLDKPTCGGPDQGVTQDGNQHRGE